MRNERQPIQSTHATTNQIECVKGRSPVVLPLTLADAAGAAAVCRAVRWRRVVCTRRQEEARPAALEDAAADTMTQRLGHLLLEVAE